MSDSPVAAMRHEEAFAEIGALAIGALNGAEERAVMSHVSECPECAAELAAMREVVAGLPNVDSRERMPADRARSMRESLVARASASQVPVRSTGNWWRPLALAASVAMVALGVA